MLPEHGLLLKPKEVGELFAKGDSRKYLFGFTRLYRLVTGFKELDLALVRMKCELQNEECKADMPAEELDGFGNAVMRRLASRVVRLPMVPSPFINCDIGNEMLSLSQVLKV